MKKLIVITLTLFLLGCSQSAAPKIGSATMGPPAIKTVMPLNVPDFYTVEHDGHKFVTTNGSSTHFIHHPDCTCLESND